MEELKFGFEIGFSGKCRGIENSEIGVANRCNEVAK